MSLLLSSSHFMYVNGLPTESVDMDSWTTYPDLLEQFPTDQQPHGHHCGYPLPHEFHPGSGSTSRDVISTRQPGNQPDQLHFLSFPQEHVVSAPHNTCTASVDETDLTTAVAPPPKFRKKKAPTLRAKDWEPYKARILELHDTQNLPLAKVKTTIEEEFGFTAELRQYQARISKWGKDKNIKSAEMAAIVRKRQQRKLIEIDKGEQSFFVRGRDVEPHKIDRWMVRHEVSQTSLYAPSPAASTPSAVLCRTISERSSMAPSPAYSTRSPNFSPRSAIPITSTPTASPPMVGCPQSITLNRQSPDHANQPLSTSMPQSLPFDDSLDDQVPHLYLQDDGEHVREGLSVAGASFEAFHSQTPELKVILECIHSLRVRTRYVAEMVQKVKEIFQEYTNDITTKFEAIQLLHEILYSQGSWHLAQKIQEWVLAVENDTLTHLAAITRMTKRVVVYSRQERLGETEELLRQTWEMVHSLRKPQPSTSYGQCVLAAEYKIQGRLEEAQDLGEQALKAAQRVLGDRHPQTLVPMAFLIQVYEDQGQLAKAGELKEQKQEVEEMERVILDGRRYEIGTSLSQMVRKQAQGVLYTF